MAMPTTFLYYYIENFPIIEYVLCVLEKQQTKQNQKFFGLSLRLKEVKKKQMK